MLDVELSSGTFFVIFNAVVMLLANSVDYVIVSALRPCFERYPNHKLVGMKSYHSEFRMQSEEECLHFCALTATRCRSIVYDSASHLCHFFLDDGAEQAEFAPRMIYFRVTAKRCLEDTIKKLPAETQALPTTTEEPKEKEFKSPVVARKRGGKLAKRKQIDSADWEAMDDLLDDIERNTEAFEIEQRKEKRARDDGERAELREIKEQIRKHLKEKIETLRENYPEMYEELMGRDVEEEEEQEETTTTTTTTQRPINDGEIPFRRKKVARAPEKEVTTIANIVANDDELKSEDLGVLVPEAEEKPVEKKFLAIPDVRSEEIEYEDDAVVRKPVSEIRKSPTKPVVKQDEKKTELKKNTFSKAELFAQQLSGGAVVEDLPEPTTTPPTTTTTRAARTAYTRRAVMARRVITTTTTEAPEPIEIEHETEAPQFSIKSRPVVDDETADSEAPVTGCLEDEIPLWVRFENAEPDIDGPKGSAPVESREACQSACNEVDGVRSITFSEKDNSCQCNVDFDGISMRKSAADDFSVSTSTRFCFASERWIVYLNGSKPKYQTFETNKAYYVKVSPRESFESLPPSYEGLQLCIELCSLSTDYACKSATFDFEAGKCELNDADSASNPSDFA
ncbi:hypothetical protein PRIPAC_87918 [Pristionchus pacificus]|uniref:Uncharacterized protein n=1 Tax=Pristionchus pacificus TaxID=54126 RepID=A0A2A6CTB6_PRIPA|nr:hypothetical protein PRIPAC_87918 [Pristionchus pacificus]|eukprot:PDM81348.1 hypothetical protein PRIPAC_35224 [Pristionchus pacificus]